MHSMVKRQCFALIVARTLKTANRMIRSLFAMKVRDTPNFIVCRSSFALALASTQKKLNKFESFFISLYAV